MEYDKLPLRLIYPESFPSTNHFLYLQSLDMPCLLDSKYSALEDLADAYSGAFVAVNILKDLLRSKKSRKSGENAKGFEEMLFWFREKDMRRFDSPFYFGLRTTIEKSGQSRFLSGARNFIEEFEAQKENKSLDTEFSF